ncbi:glycosyltransferase family 2 protein [Pseudanabaena sp. ABRG5-3]|uniref:glycosyltransferase family 2 protein n=1 Tax=Pseudanabaena sp. ABRG5-3 TaxID=685565 RepID=UPI000DC6DC81|nr:glycosyltransferase family A protein [Pseudanabaena sp. ABRG5-3]BBC24288.1 glycosyl transferase family 2 [Pseudanabaena sp. ABRG5-3]
MPKVSIVIVNYNYGKYLDERIRTILNQSYKDFELIIVDNGSTDNSVEIINHYISDSRVIPNFYPENVSPYKRWNYAADIAQGDYLLISSADDSCHPRMLEKLTEKLDNHPEVGLAYTQSIEIDNEGTTLRSFKQYTDELDIDHWSSDFINSGKEECKYLFFKCTIPNSSGVLMRRKIFIESGKFDVQMPFSADWMLYAKILMNSDIAFVAEPLNYHRIHPNVMRKNNRDDIFLEERLQVLYYLFNHLQPPDSFITKIYDPTIGWWLRVIASGKSTFSGNQRIYRILKDINPTLNYRVVKNLIEIVKRKLKISSNLSDSILVDNKAFTDSIK